MSLRVTVLGSGSPTPSLQRSQPAALVEWDDGHALVDCGDGVTQQLLRAQRKPAAIDHVLLTHLHWDHILGYPAFVWGSWTMGRRSLRVWGPPGTGAMHDHLVAGYYVDQATWSMELGFNRSGWEDIEVSEVAPHDTIELGGCTVTVGKVIHPPMQALAYRFDHAGRSVVISGDTARCDQLVELARGADVMVVDACAAPPPPGSSPARVELIGRLHRYHASPTEAIQMGRAAGVGTIVLTHHLPGVAFGENLGDDVVVAEDLVTYEA